MASAPRPTYFLSSRLFLKLMAALYLIAFISLWVQIIGLVGSEGILPVEDFLRSLRERMGLERYWVVPTVFWLDSSDHMLHFVGGAGCLLSLLAFWGVAQGPCFFLLWGLYLSLVSICRDFLGFQWDNLLLEAGFLSIFLTSWEVRPKGPFALEPDRIVLLLLRFLLFKLMFSSGAVKLAGGDPTWRDLTALTFHYETQPLPTWIGWYVHQLPVWFQKWSTIGTFVAELIVPFFIFGPRSLRLIACVVNIVFQILIMMTGNYCFFNLLTIALSILLVDDAVCFRISKAGRGFESWASDRTLPSVPWRKVVVAPMAVAYLLLATVKITGANRLLVPWPRPLLQFHYLVSPLRTVNSYGLFARMTTSRPEIIVEGSNDGVNWRAYEFKWKPGNLAKRPDFVQPHQPRLDWQMWFAALGSYRHNPWFIHFLVRILEGKDSVLALLEKNPFPESPPRYIRGMLYEYHFTDWKTKREQGLWWRRERKGLYCPVLSLQPPVREQFS